MGTMTFQLPPNPPCDARHECERACVISGQDGMPYATHARVEGDRLILQRDGDESGSALVPWHIDGRGLLMTATGTLMERSAAYALLMELARGKVNQVRSQAAEWLMGGLLLPAPLEEQLRRATSAFTGAVSRQLEPEAPSAAWAALTESYAAAEQLVAAYAHQVFQVRHARQCRLDTLLACRLQNEEPTDDTAEALTGAVNAVVVPLSWRAIEPVEGEFNWEPADRLVNWAAARGLKIVAGPLIDFSGHNLPDWIWDRESDLLGLNGLISDWLDRVVGRYQHLIHTWQVTAGSNCAGVLARRDDELLWLTVRAAETVRRVGPQLDVIVGLAQPWGDYLVEQEGSQSPFLFADLLLRTGLKLAALDLEVIMGVTPRGSYCRDTLDLSRLLDLYALLGTPLQLTLGYPSEPKAPATACPDERVGAGWWRDGFTPAAQADWGAAFTRLALCKPFVRSVQWAHLSDAQPHQFPACGLFDTAGRPKPVLHELTRLRAEHLK